jgi:SecD/SecF fusion protein
MPIGALMLFGGETLRDFGFALLVGVASGTYSSIFIAAPVLTHWKEREPGYRRRRQLVMEDHGGVIPAYSETRLGDDEDVEPERGPGARERLARRGRRARGRDGAPPAETPPPRPPEPEVEEPAAPVTTGVPGGGPAAGPGGRVEMKPAPAKPAPAAEPDPAQPSEEVSDVRARAAARAAARKASRPRPADGGSTSTTGGAPAADGDPPPGGQAPSDGGSRKQRGGKRQRKRHGRR